MSLDKLSITGLTLTLIIAAQLAADDKLARDLVEKGIRAQGGRGALERFSGGSAKIKGRLHFLGDPLDFTGELAMQGEDQHKIVIDTQVDGQKVRMTRSINRDQAWNQINEQIEELEGDALREAKEEAFTEWVSSLLPLNRPEFLLSLVGETIIENRPAIGVNAAHEGHRDVNLYFDKGTGLLIKTETRVKEETTRQEITQETFLSDFKEVQNIKLPMKFVVKRDGKLLIVGEMLNYQRAEKLDDSIFAKP